MKANEMERWNLEGDGDEAIMLAMEYGDYVRHSDAMQVIQALEAKIKGMIDKGKDYCRFHEDYYRNHHEPKEL